MAKKLKDIDSMAEEKGSFLVTAWQFVKFIVVSLLACIVQFGLVNLIPLIPQIKELYGTAFHWFVFDYPVTQNAAGEIVSGGLGYFIAFNVANIAAQIVAFFVNKENLQFERKCCSNPSDLHHLHHCAYMLLCMAFPNP